MTTLFITGTDTGVGKTTIAVMLLRQLNQQGYKTFAMKPIASGCEYNKDQQLENADALLLQSASSLSDTYERVNPFALTLPIAPHLSAKNMGITLDKNTIIKKILSSIRHDADFNIIEGAGGFCVPLNDHELYSDVIAELSVPTILVVGLRLGCLNHAILTVQNMLQRKINMIGWVANCIDPEMKAVDENIETLKRWIKQPCLGIVSYQRIKLV